MFDKFVDNLHTLKRASKYLYNAYVYQRETFLIEKYKSHFIQALMLEDLIIPMTLGYGRLSNENFQEN